MRLSTILIIISALSLIESQTVEKDKKEDYVFSGVYTLVEKFVKTFFSDDSSKKTFTSINDKAVQVVDPYYKTVKGYVTTETVYGFSVFMIIIVAWNFAYKLVICPIWCFLWRFIFCVIDNGRRSIHRQRRGYEHDYF